MQDEENKIEKVQDVTTFNDKVVEIIKDFLAHEGFTARKITDTPLEDLQVVPRKYVNMYGSIAGRPQNSVIGQQYFDTTNGYPIFRNTNNAWVNGQGSVIG